MNATPTRVQPVAGLRIETRKIGSSRYGYVIHEASGLPVVRADRAPMTVKVAAFVDEVRNALSGYDWSMDTDMFQKLPETERAERFRLCCNVSRRITA